MQRMIASLFVGLLIGASSFAMIETEVGKVSSSSADDSQEEGKVHNRGYWQAREPKGDVTAQADKVERILIGHTVTDEGNSILTLQAIQNEQMDRPKNPFSDICYNFCLDKAGDCFECRPVHQAPALLYGHNLGSCGVGVIGKYHEEIVTDEMAVMWGKQIGKIAHRYGFVSLERGVNIFGMTDREPVRFPDSPGKFFVEKFPLIIDIANQKLESLRAK